MAASGPKDARDALVSDQLGQPGRPPDLAIGLAGSALDFLGVQPGAGFCAARTALGSMLSAPARS